MQPLSPTTLPLRGTSLIEASAGTGKTYTIATLYCRLVAENGLRVDEILVVTFTEAAAAELRERVRNRLAEAVRAFEDPATADPVLRAWAESRSATAAEDRRRLVFALRTFDEASVSTIHGFCHRVLHDRAFETGVAFETELIINPMPMLDEAVRDFWARELYDADPRFVGYLLDTHATPPTLLRLAATAAAHPAIPVIPSGAGSRDAPDFTPFQAAFDHARALWPTCSAEVRELLLNHQGLHVRSYPKDKLPRWFFALDAFLGHDDPGARLGFEQLTKFTPQTLEKYTKADFKRRGLVPQHPFFDACADLVAAREPLLRDYAERYVGFKRRLIRFVERELPARKREAAVQSFDDLLHDVDRALARRKTGKPLAAAIREKYRAALIDEFQDTDPVQYRIFDSIYGGTDAPLLLIGDPKQAIYGFRGADVFAYLDAAAGVRAKARFTMDTNWRSDAPLLAAIERLFAVGRPFFLPGIDFIPVQPRPGAQTPLREHGEALPAFEIAFVERSETGAKKPTSQIARDWSTEHIPARVAADIARLLASDTELDGRPVAASDVAVLCRTNRQALAVQTALAGLNIPGVFYGDASVYDSRESGELMRVLDAAAEPSRAALLRAAITTELLGVTGGELETMRTDDTAWDEWVQRFRKWHTVWHERGFIQMFRALLSDAGLGRRLLALPDGERRMTNLLHLAELLHTAASTDHLGPAGLVHWFSEQTRIDQLASDAVKLRLERDDEAVQLITIHRAKGLEYPIVYCPYLWAPDELRFDEVDNLLFHDEEQGNRLTLDITVKPGGRERLRLPRAKRAQFEISAESLRLLYVALTRARHRCVVVWGGFHRAHHSALGYLLHGPDPTTHEGDAPIDLVAAQIKDCDDAQLQAHLAMRGEDLWKVRSIPAAPAPRYVPPRAKAETLSHRRPVRAFDRLFRTTSFTAMSSAHTDDTARSEGRDYDHVVPAPVVPRATESPIVPLADFPKGATAGNFFHDVLEHVDFAADDAEIRDMVSQRIGRYGIEESYVDTAVLGVRNALRTPLLDDGMCLHDVPATRRRAELGFVLDAMTPARGEEATPALDRHGLARVFANHPQGLPDDYASSIAKLGFRPLRGFLKGFIDLVFQHGERWYVVDYKTNMLGPRFDDYAPPALSDAMGHAHYVLQYHLYTLAVCRHLRSRIAGFDYERHFGGALYLFMRGMEPGLGPSRGVYFERPPKARIDALDDAFGDREQPRVLERPS